MVKLVQNRGLVLGADEKDPYVNAIRALIRQGSDVYLLDRLLTAGVIEARGAERFGLVAEALPEGDLKNFYRSITRSECRHFELFLDLAKEYFSAEVIESRWQALLDAEACGIRPPPPAADAAASPDAAAASSDAAELAPSTAVGADDVRAKYADKLRRRTNKAADAASSPSEQRVGGYSFTTGARDTMEYFDMRRGLR